MNLVSRKGVIWNTIGSTMWAANSFILLLFVSRTTDIGTVGRFGISLTTAQLLYIVGVFGTNSYQMTDFKFKYNFIDYLWLKIFTCISTLLICVVIMIVTQDIQQRKFLLLLSIFMAINAFSGIYQSLFFQHNRLDLSGQALFFRHFISLLSFILVMLLCNNVVAALISLVLVDAVCTWIWGARLVSRFTDLSCPFQRDRLRELFMECFPLFFSVFLMTYLLSVTKYAIQANLNSEAQGYFNIIFTPVLIVNLCSQFIFKPLLNHYYSLLEKKEKAPLFHVMLRHSLLIVLFTVFCCVVLFFFGVPVVKFLYEVDISAFRTDLVIIMLGGGIFALCQMLYYILLLRRKLLSILSTYLLVSSVATALSWYFVQSWALRGASLAFLMSHILLLIVFLFFTLRSDMKHEIEEAPNGLDSAS